MKKLGLVLVLVFLFGCASDPVKPDAPVVKPNQQIVRQPVILTPIQLGEKEPDLKVGTKITLRQGNAITKQWNIMVWVVKPGVTWQGKNAYLIDTSGGQGIQYMIWDRYLNIMATVDGQGKVINAFDPCVKLFAFPMKVGASYQAVYDYWAGGKKVAGISDQLKVEGKETVQVPAGLYEVFVIKRSATQLTEYHYYSPMLGFPVKWRWTQLIDHPNGPGEFVTELVKIEMEK